MSEESDLDVFSGVAQKRKRSTRRIEDSGSSSDSPFEQRRAHKRVLVSDICQLSTLCLSSQFIIITSAVCSLKIKICKTKFLYFLLMRVCCLTLRDKHRLKVFENSVLRRMFRPNTEEEKRRWRKLHKGTRLSITPRRCGK